MRQGKDSLNMFTIGVCLAKTRLAFHMRSPDYKQSQVDFRQVLLQQPSRANSCQFCGRICGFAVGLRNHKLKQVGYVNPKDRSFACHICGRVCKGEVVLRSHMNSQRHLLQN